MQNLGFLQKLKKWLLTFFNAVGDDVTRIREVYLDCAESLDV